MIPTPNVEPGIASAAAPGSSVDLEPEDFVDEDDRDWSGREDVDTVLLESRGGSANA
jgi:hypothetical protein